MKRVFLLWYFVLATLYCSSQTKQIDSLKLVLKTAKQDTNKLKALNSLSWALYIQNMDTAILLSTQALNAANSILTSSTFSSQNVKEVKKCKGKSYNQLGIFSYFKGNYADALENYKKAIAVWGEADFKKGQAKTLTNMGAIYLSQGDYGKALEYTLLSLKIEELLGDKIASSSALSNIGLIYWNQGDYPKALEFYFKALKIEEEFHVDKSKSSTLGNIGLVYWSQDDLESALKYYEMALSAYEIEGDKKGIAINLANIGLVYHKKKEYPKALGYFLKAAKTHEEINNKSGLATALKNIGTVYEEEGDSARAKKNISYALTNRYPKANDYYLRSLKLSEELGDKDGVCSILSNLGSLYFNQKNYKESETTFLKSLDIAGSIGSLNTIKYDHFGLSELYNVTQQYTKALEHYKKYIVSKDSLLNEENTKKTVQLEMNYTFEKKEAAAKLEQEKKEVVATAESKKQRIIIWSVCGILLLVFGFAIFAYRSYLQKQKANEAITKQKELIEEKQKEILDSIHYAKRIQTALLPNENYIKRYLKN
jgi:tetratricopeptide (TPR) repeat protein